MIGRKVFAKGPMPSRLFAFAENSVELAVEYNLAEVVLWLLKFTKTENGCG